MNSDAANFSERGFVLIPVVLGLSFLVLLNLYGSLQARIAKQAEQVFVRAVQAHNHSTFVTFEQLDWPQQSPPTTAARTTLLYTQDPFSSFHWERALRGATKIACPPNLTQLNDPSAYTCVDFPSMSEERVYTLGNLRSDTTLELSPDQDMLIVRGSLQLNGGLRLKPGSPNDFLLVAFGDIELTSIVPERRKVFLLSVHGSITIHDAIAQTSCPNPPCCEGWLQLRAKQGLHVGGQRPESSPRVCFSGIFPELYPELKILGDFPLSLTSSDD